MDSALTLIISLNVLTCLLGVLCLYSDKITRLIILLAVTSFLGFINYSIVEILGKHREVSMSLFTDEEVTVVSHVIVPKKYIYLWVQRDGQKAPTYFGMPWAEQAQQQLEKATKEAGRRNQKAKMRLRPNTETLVDEPMFYPPFVSRAPEKPMLERNGSVGPYKFKG